MTSTSSGVEPTTFHGLPALRLRSHGGAEAIVSLFGAQVLSWKPASQRQWLFLSDSAVFDQHMPIRGGAPICFPQFSTLGALTRHGFARTAQWLCEEQRRVDGSTLVSLSLPAEVATQAGWPHQAKVDFTVVIDDARLDMELGVENIGTEPLDFTAALHTYLQVSDVEDIQLSGLRGCQYRNAAAGNVISDEKGNVVVIRGEVDRVYHDVPGALMLSDGDRSLGINADNFPDVVVWNPGVERSREFSDLGAEDWRRFVCIEAGAIQTPVALAAGEEWWARQTLVDLTSAAASHRE